MQDLGAFPSGDRIENSEPSENLLHQVPGSLQAVLLVTSAYIHLDEETLSQGKLKLQGTLFHHVLNFGAREFPAFR